MSGDSVAATRKSFVQVKYISSFESFEPQCVGMAPRRAVGRVRASRPQRSVRALRKRLWRGVIRVSTDKKAVRFRQVLRDRAYAARLQHEAAADLPPLGVGDDLGAGDLVAGGGDAQTTRLLTMEYMVSASAAAIRVFTAIQVGVAVGATRNDAWHRRMMDLLGDASALCDEINSVFFDSQRHAATGDQNFENFCKLLIEELREHRQSPF